MNEENKTKLLSAGSELIGASAGAALGLVGGPIGAILGSAAGVAISKSLSEFASMILSNRETARVGAAIQLAGSSIKNRLEQGEQLRQDSFFSPTNNRRSSADELFEGILLKCKNEYEEKKIEYITKIYENVAFNSSVKPEHANQILNVVQRLSYMQLRVLAFTGQNRNNKFNVRTESYRDKPLAVYESDLLFVLQDFVSLDKEGLMHTNDSTAMLGYIDVVPGGMVLSVIGADYYNLMNLHEMPESEFDFIDLLLT